MRPKLKNCPFCGSKAFFEINEGKYGPFLCVKCDYCGAKSRTFISDFGYEKDNEKIWDEDQNRAIRNAAKFWNKRVVHMEEEE